MKSRSKLWNFLLLVRHPKVKPFWDRGLQFALRLLGEKGAARLALFGVDWGRFDSQQEIILCLGRDFFRKDVEQLRKIQKWNYVVLEAGFTKLQQTWTPNEMQIQVEHQNFHGPKYDRAREKSKRFAIEVIRLIGRKQKVCGILSANVDYWQDEGFIRAGEVLKIPFLSVCREHAVIESVQKNALTYYKKMGHRYRGQAVAVAGKASKKLMVECGSCSEDQIFITGFPRLDVWRNLEANRLTRERDLVTLLTYTEGYSADLNFRKVFSWLMEIALEMPAQKFLVKCKNHDDVHVVKSLFGDVPENVHIECEISLYNALSRSQVVVGFNSLALVEGLLAGAPLAIPYFGESARPQEDLMFFPGQPQVQKSVTFFRDRGEFKQQIFNSRINQDHSITINWELINEFFFIDPEKSAVHYVEDFLEQNLKS